MARQVDPARWKRVETLFGAALALPEANREDYLAEACAGDSDLLAELRSLLAAHGDADSFLDRPVLGSRLRLESDGHAIAGNLLGRSIGCYRLEEVIASGGMGTVYLGVHLDEKIDRRVAIKIIKPGMDTEAILRRFARERRALAELNHPNIARFLDGGSTDEGLPYLIMEYVEGETLDAYCEQRALPLTRRLELFRAVCAGVHYAHGKLVVHRDIKPRNIAVTPTGQPKLLDFGIAKILDSEGEAPVTTTPSQRFLSPDYASPEQIRGEPITTATDVYSLGVTLYELLTGRRPFHVTGRSPAQIERIVCEEDPTKPSLAIGRSGTGRDRLVRQLEGDLDTIVLKALRKEPGERYPSVAEFKEDIGRHLLGLPVSARHPTLRYRLGKFVRRNRGAVIAGALLLLSVFAGTVGIVREARRARAEAEATNLVLSYLDRLLADLDPLVAGSEVTVEQILDGGSERMMRELADLPHAQGMLAERIAGVYESLGLHGKAIPWRERGLAIHRAAYGEEHHKVANGLHGLGAALRVTDLPRAERNLREARRMRIRLHGEASIEVARTTQILGGVLWRQGKFREADPLLREALEAYRRVFREPHAELVGGLRAMSGFLLEIGRYDEAERLAREAVQLAERLGPAYDSRYVKNTLAGVLQDQGRYREAEPLFRERLAMSRAKLGETHPTVLSDKVNLALLLKDMGELPAAEALCRETLETARALSGEEHRFLRGEAWSALANTLWDKNEPLEAEAAIRLAVELSRNAASRGERMTLLALTLIETGRYEEAEAQAREAQRLLRDVLPDGSWKIAKAESVHGAALAKLRRYEEAEGLLVRSYPVIRDDRGVAHRRTQEALQRLIALYEAWQKPVEADRYSGLLRASRAAAPAEPAP